MTAFGRLWSRAPLWRGALLIAAVASGLTALYPPALPWRAPDAAHYSPLPAADPRPIAPSQSAAPPIGQGLPIALAPSVSTHGLVFGAVATTAIAIAGTEVPLPEGAWTVVSSMSARAPTGQDFVAGILARFADGRMDAAMLLTVVLPAAGIHGGYPVNALCQPSIRFTGRIFSAVDHGLQDSWCIDSVTAAYWDNPAAPGFVRSGFADVRQRGMVLPPAALRVIFDQSDQDHLLHVELFSALTGPLPAGAAPGGLPEVVRLRDWAAGWHDLLRRSFQGILQPPDVTAALSILPVAEVVAKHP